MKKTALITLVVFCTSALAAQAALIEFVASASTVDLGDPVELALRISDLGDGVAPSVGAFDIEVTFDPEILDLTTVVFGDPFLGDQLDLFGLGSIMSATPFPGRVNLFELSLDFPSDLDDLQAPTFTLATLTFNTIATGATVIAPSVIAIGDSLGVALDTDATAGTVTVRGRAVPEPTSFALFGLGLAAAGVFRRSDY